MTVKEQLHRLVDELPNDEQKLLKVRDLIVEQLQHWDAGEQPSDPVLQAFLNAPEDDEPETIEEAAAVQEAREALARGEVVTLEELRRQIGW